MKSLSRVQLFATPWTIAYQASLSMEFSRQGYWRGLPFPTPGDLPDPGIESASPALAGGFFTTEPPGKPQESFMFHLFITSSTLNLWQPLILLVSTVFPFPECHIVGITQYLAFLDWLLSLSNMLLSFLHVFSCLESSFLFITE